MILRPTLLVLLSLFITSGVTAKPKVTYKTIYYDVEGKTYNQIRRSLNENSINHIKGKTYDGMTNDRVNWNFNYKKSKGRCRVTSVSTKLKIRYQMPRLTSFATASNVLKLRWITYYDSLDEHEKVHGKIARQSATAIERGIRKVSRKKCSSLKRAANNKGDSIYDSYAQKQKDYDAEPTIIVALWKRPDLNFKYEWNEFEHYFEGSKFDFSKRFEIGRGISKHPDAAARWLLVAFADGEEKATKTLLKGSPRLKSSTAKALQTYLKKVEFYDGKIDGQFGNMSRTALNNWNNPERARRLEKDLLSNKYD